MAGGYTLGTIRGTIAIDYDGAGVIKAQTDVDRLKNSGVGTQEALRKTSATLAAGGAVIAGGFAVAFNAAKNFEKGLSAIQAVSGATGSQLEQIRAKALQLGKDTAFSATDAASAMEELVKAGVSVTDVLNGAADATVALAAAGGISLPEAATISANAMNSFGLSAQQLPKVADLIAGAANASAIDVGQFGQSLQQAGAVAHLAGLSFDDTAVAIAEMGNAGIKGSDAGTSLKTFLQNLIPQTKQQIALFDQLGITTNGAGNKFFDASGKVKGLADVSQVLQNALRGQNKEQQLATLQTLFGSDAIRAAAVLADNGAQGFNTLAGAMGKVTAEATAAQRLNNTAGQLEQLKGSAETLAIQIGTLLIPAITSLVRQVTGIVNWFANLSTQTQTTIAVVAGVIGVVLLVGAAIVKIIEIVKAFQVAWTVLNASFIASPIGLIITAIVLLVAVFILLWTRSAAFRNFWIGLWNSIWNFMKAIGAWFAGPFANFFIALWQQIVTIFNAVKNFIVSVWNGIVSAASTAWNAIWGVIKPVIDFVVAGVRGWIIIISAVLNFLAPLFQAIFGLIVNIVQTAWNIITAIFQVAFTIWNATIGAALRFIFNLIVIWFQGMIAFWQAAWNIIWTVIQVVWNAIMAVVMPIVNFLRALISAWLTGMIALWSAIWNAVVAFVSGAWNVISNIIGAAVGFARGVISAWLNGMIGLWSGVWNFIVGLVQGAVARVTAIINGISAIVGAVGRFFGQLRDAASGGVGSLISFVAGIPGRVLDALGNLGSLLYQSGVNIIQGLVNGIMSMIGRVRDAVSNVLSEARNLLPFSPAKKGPFSGRGWTLFSGMAMMGDLARGIDRAAQQPVQAMTGVLGTVHTAATGSGAQNGSGTVVQGNSGPTLHVSQTINDQSGDPKATANAVLQKLAFGVKTGTSAATAGV